MKKFTIHFVIISFLLSQSLLVVYPEKSFFDSGAPFIQRERWQVVEHFSMNDIDLRWTETIITKIKDYGVFVYETANGLPQAYSFSGATDTVFNASYQDDVHLGFYSYLLKTKGTTQYASYVTSYRYCQNNNGNYPYLNESLTFDLWFKVIANPDIAIGSSIYFYLQILTSSASYYLYYAISDDAILSNSTYYAYYDVRGTTGSWLNLHRNLTEDFTEAFSKPIDDSMRVNCFYIYLYSIVAATGSVELVMDDVSFVNSSSYDYFSENGDFEAGTGERWLQHSRCAPTVALTSADYTEGQKAVNITASTDRKNSVSYFSLEKLLFSSFNGYYDGLYGEDPTDLVIEFDWKFCNGSSLINGEQAATFRLNLQNSTHVVTLIFQIGSNSGTLTVSNYTNPSYIQIALGAPGFEAAYTWQHFRVDVFELLSMLNLNNLALYHLSFYLYSQTTETSYVNLFVDDLQVITYPASDPGFENCFDWLPNNGLISWRSIDVDYNNRTSDAHSGLYAANISSYDNYYLSSCYRNLYFPVEQNLYTDFWWKINKLEVDTNDYTAITIEVNDTQTLNYVLGSSTTVSSIVNGSNDVYYLVKDFNTTGIWNNLVRNIYADLFIAFGMNNWVITKIILKSYATGASSVVETIFDDINFIRDVAGPILSNGGVAPAQPQYFEQMNFSVDVQDNFGVLEVNFHYKIGASGWQTSIMTFDGSTYKDTLPQTAWGTEIQYYFSAIDVQGIESTLGTETTPYSFEVADNIDPELIVEAPSTTTPLAGTVRFNLTGTDDGSGINAFNIVVNGVTIYSDSIVPASFLWDTENYTNGLYTIQFILEDNAGNSAMEQFTYDIENPISWYIQFANFFKQWWPYLTAGAGVLVIAIVTIVIVVKVKRKRAAP